MNSSNQNFKQNIVRGKDQTWVWIFDNLYTLISITGISKSSGLESDDIVQETLEYIFKYNKDKGINLAQKIYQEKNVGLLLSILRKSIDLRNGMQFFESQSDFARYKKIHAVCEQYHITEEPKNAYLISAIINEKVFSIPLIEQILLKKKPKVVSYDTYDYSFKYNCEENV